MKKIISLLVLLFSTPAWAGVPCSVPFQLQNNTVADATQVMANYNAILTCLGNAAAAGANNDITSLNALSTPISPAQGGTSLFVGGTSSGTNTQIVSTLTPSSGFSLTSGRQVLFIVGVSNTGPTTLNVVSSGNVNFFRRTQGGIGPMVGGELVPSHPAIAEYDGTEFVLISSGPDLVGEIRDFAGVTAPAGWLFIDGSCQVRTTYPGLFSVIGTTYDPTGSTCDSAHFALPDGRGRVLVGQDTLGTRITNAGSGCNGAALGGAGCGTQNVTISQANLPAVTLTTTITDNGHTHPVVIANNPGVFTGPNGNHTTFGGTGGNAGTDTALAATSTTGITASTALGGSGTVTPILQPLQIVNKIIKL